MENYSKTVTDMEFFEQVYGGTTDAEAIISGIEKASIL